MKSLPCEPGGQKNEERPVPSGDDILQAATLLIGVYGRDAAAYADGRRSEVETCGDAVATRTWQSIVTQIEHLLQSAPVTQLH
jgi:hypothetical protein